MKLPKEGDFITIQSYKHDGRLHRTWRDTMVLKTTENAVIGVNDHTLVTEADGRRWVTREPAIVYFHKKYWFNIIAMIRDNGISYYCNLASPYILDQEALKYIDILKVNEHEMEVLTGQTDIKQAALQLAEWGVKEVLITLGSLGSIIYAEGTFHKIPAYPPKDIVDATGCGDTYATGYLYMRNKGASYEEAGCFAAAMSTLKLEASGPFSKTEEDVWNIIRTSSLKAEKI